MSKNLISDEDRERIVLIWKEVISIYSSVMASRFPSRQRVMVSRLEIGPLAPLVAAAWLKLVS